MASNLELIQEISEDLAVGPSADHFDLTFELSHRLSRSNRIPVCWRVLNCGSRTDHRARAKIGPYES